MSDRYNITCDRCKAEITHVCDPELKETVKRLYKFCVHGGMPEGIVKQAKKWGYFDKGDDADDIPFFSETFLYCAIGKDDARSVLGLVNHIIRMAGLDPHAIEMEACQEMEAEAKRREELHKRQQLLRKIKKSAKGLNVEESDWPLVDHLEKYKDRWQVSEPFTRKGKQWKRFTEIELPKEA